MNRRIVAAGVAALAVAGGGTALAASGVLSPQEQSKAVIDDAAQQLGVSPAKLSDALKQAYENQVDAAVAAGRLTKEQGEALRQRIQSQEYPLLGPGFEHHGPGGPGGHGFPHLDAAAAYLGLSTSELQTQLQSGKTLAEIAKAQGKTVDGLVTSLVADEKKELDAAVKAGRLTQAQADQLLAGAKQRFTDMANGVRPEGGPRGFFGPPPMDAPNSDASFQDGSL
jgi:hypothetical protein